MIITELKQRLQSLIAGRTEVIQPRSGPAGPDFICFGLQKAGTRWLFDQFNARPDVWMPPIKEISFFAKDCFKPDNLAILKNGGGTLPLCSSGNDELKRKLFLEHFSTYDPDTLDIQWYKDLFEFKESKKSGDISPYYCKLDNEEIEFVSTSLPSTKFVFLLRDPVDRFWSGLNMKVRKNLFTADQITNWTKLKQIIRENEKLQINLPTASIWKKWSNKISSDRIRYWFFDDIVTTPEQVFTQISKFIEIADGPGKLPFNFNRKKKNKKIEIPPEIRVKLIGYFADEYTECAGLFGGHAKNWLDRQMMLSKYQTRDA